MIEILYHYEDDKSQKDIVSDLKDFSSSNFSIFETAKKNKKEKKEKKKEKKRSKSIFSLDEMPGDVEMKNEVDLDEIIRHLDPEYEKSEGLDDSIINEQKRGYDKLKRQDNDFKKEFAEELTLLYNLLSESNTFGKKLEKKYELLDGNKTRNSSKYTSDLIDSIISNKNSKLAVLREIANIKKIIADLKIKDTKTKDEKTTSMDYLASSYLKNILSYGRQNFVKNMTHENDQCEFDEYDVDENKPGNRDLNEYEYDNFNQMIDDRLVDSEHPFRSYASDKFIEYEKSGVNIMVKRDIDTSEWDFVAIDKLNQVIDDYPIPSKKYISKMRFSDDGRLATDQFGRSYKVLENYDLGDTV